MATLRWILDVNSPNAAKTFDEIGTRMPDSREFDFFRLGSGTPVLVVSRTAYSVDRPIRLTTYIYRGDRVRLLHVEGDIPGRYREV